MHDVIAALARVGADPIPTPTMTVDPTLVTPGPWGFAVIVLVVFAVILLVFDMLRRIRRGRVRADIAEELQAEKQAQEAAAAESGDEDGTASGDAAPPRS
jgi:hypothetical protein